MLRELDPETSVAYGPPGAARAARCEPACTRLRTTLCLPLLALAVAFSAACGGSGPGAKSYDEAVSKQEACCNQLADPAARSQCLDGIVRVDDPAVQTADANRATYACVERHFQCDPATGTATKSSAQAQLDCINDIRE